MVDKRLSARSAIAGCVVVCVIAGGVVGGLYFQSGSRVLSENVPAAIKSDDQEIMRQRAHGTCLGPVQKPLRWGCSWSKADDISCFNRHWAERSGYWETTDFFAEEGKGTKLNSGTVTFYDSVTSEPLFQAPVGRSWDDFIHESLHHGWPSFRDEEVLSDRVRVLPDGETVSLDGTHLGHNLPDNKGNRYCINLVSVAGYAPDTAQGKTAQAAIGWNKDAKTR